MSIALPAEAEFSIQREDGSWERIWPPADRVWSRYFNEYIHPKSVAAIVTREFVRREQSRFDVGHEIVLPERGRKVSHD